MMRACDPTVMQPCLAFFKSWAFPALALLASTIPSRATNRTWTGATSTDFQVSGNWSSSRLPADNLTSDTAVFSGTVRPNQPSLTASRSVAGLLFSTVTGGWQLGGASSFTLSLGASGVSTAGQTSGTDTIAANLSLGASQTWIAGTGGTLLVTGSVLTSGTFSLDFSDTTNHGTVTLSPASGNAVNLANAAVTVANGNVLALGGTGANATASVNTITNSGANNSTWGITAGGVLQVNSGTWIVGDLGQNGPQAFSGALNVSGGGINFAGGRFLGGGTITVTGGTLAFSNATSLLTNGGRFSLGAISSGTSAAMTITGGTVDLAQSNSGNSIGAAIPTQVNQSGGTLRNGLTTGGGANGGTSASFTIGVSGSISNVASAYTLSGSGVFLCAGTVQGQALTTGTNDISNFNFNGGTLCAATFDPTYLGYASATGAAHANPVANCVGKGTLFNNGGTLAPGYGGTPGETIITGNYTVNSGALVIGLSGTTQASAFQTGQYDFLSVTGTATLGGNLNVALLGGYKPGGGDVFTIVSAGGVAGAFANVASGGRITTDGGEGTFAVTVSGTTVVLGGYVSNIPTAPPVITTQPLSITVVAGQSATFNVAVAADGIRTFQWYKNGGVITGATNSFYTIASAQSADAASYSVAVTNTLGSVTSSAAQLTVSASDTSTSGILSLPSDVLGSGTAGAAHPGGLPLTYDTSGLRTFRPVPPVGVHPRIFVDDGDRAEIKTRLKNGSAVSNEALKQIRACLTLMRLGIPGYNNSAYFPAADQTFPDGTARIANTGLLDGSSVYADLISGSSASLAAMNPSNRISLAGEMALEAFYCWVFQDDPTEPGQPSFTQRRLDLATAMTTWCNSVDPTTLNTGTRDTAGGIHMAYAYDFAYPVMTAAQRSAVRSKLALMIYQDPSQVRGVPTEPCATTTNWVMIDLWNQSILLAFEGEGNVPETPFDAAFYNNYFTQQMGAIHKYYTYGFYPSGTPYEGLGKNFQGDVMSVAYARRGYNFFAHPHVRNYARKYLPAITSPWGFGVNTDDQIGGTGPDPERGKNAVNPHDPIGLQWAFHYGATRDPMVDYVWRNSVQSDSKINGVAAQFPNFSRFDMRSTYGNQLLLGVMFAQDFDSSQTQTALATTALSGSTAFISRDRGQVISRSGFDENSQLLNFSARQDFGGHTHADRGNFTLLGNGRVFCSYMTILANTPLLQDAAYHNVVLVDDAGVSVTPTDGTKARQPAKLAAVVDGANATAATSDATYAYTWSFGWSTKPTGTALTAKAALDSFNTFRRSDAKIAQAYGDIAFYNYPHWLTGNSIEAIEKTPARAYAMRNVYRTATMVRGARPYQIIVDDVRADDSAAHNFKWLAQIPSDLSMISQTATDTIFGDTNGKRLLIRLLQADGTPVQYPGSTGSSAAYLRTDSSVVVAGQNNRFVVERAGISAPNFKILLYIHNAGDPLPVTTWSDATPDNVSGANDTVTVSLAGQTDTITFAPRAIAVTGVQPGANPVVTEMTISRSGAGTLLDTCGSIEPAAISRSAGVFKSTTAPTQLSGTASGSTNLLTWSAAPGAESYRVKRSSTRGGPYSVLGTAYWMNFSDPSATAPGVSYYVVSALDAAGNETVNSAEATVSTLPMPRGWSAADVGAPTLAGSTTATGTNSFQLTAGGSDVWGSVDQFQFTSVPWSGDGTLIARVVSIANTDAWAKAGVMFRDSLAAGAINTFAAVSATNGVVFQRRTATDASTSSQSTSGLLPPYWMKLQRTGNVFQAYRSPDGITWTQLGSAQTVTMSNATIYAGLAVSSHNTNALTTAVFDNVQFIGAPVAPTNLSATALSESQLQLSWTNPAFNDTGALVQVSRSGSNTWTIVTNALSAGSTGCLAGGLAASTSYDFRVALTNSTGNSAWAMLTAATPAGIGDGIPGAWRLQYFGNGLAIIPGLSGLNDDPDGDGKTNIQEFLAGTSPIDAASALRITSIARAGANIVVTFPTVAGKTYALDRATVLASPPVWSTVLDGIAGSGQPATVSDAGAADLPRAFYRVRLSP